MVQAGTAGPGTYQGIEEELNHPSEFLETRTQGSAGAFGNSPTQRAFLDPGEGYGWDGYMKTRNPHLLANRLVISKQRP